VEFTPKEGVTKRLDLKEGKDCPKCTGHLFYERKKLSAKRKKKNYHYCQWLKCRDCRAVFMEEKFKTLKGVSCSCNPSSLVEITSKGFLREIEDLGKKDTISGKNGIRK